MVCRLGESLAQAPPWTRLASVACSAATAASIRITFTVTSSASTIAQLATHKDQAALQIIAENAATLVESLKWFSTTVGVYVLLLAYLLLLRRLRKLLPDEPPNSSEADGYAAAQLRRWAS